MPSRSRAAPTIITIVILGLLVIIAPLLAKYRSAPAEWVGKLEAMSADQSRAPSVDLKHSVWVNRRSGLYYCRTSKYYGKMFPGFAISQGDALQKGYRPAQGDACP
jgi:hypothetical protein